MKLAVGQIRPKVGSIDENIVRHMELVQLGAEHGADLILFPELSLTGYEPKRAAELSCDVDSPRFSQLQQLCDSNNVVVGVGFPLRTRGLPLISTLLIHPHANPRVYSKQYLHADEEPYFEHGCDHDSIIHSPPPVALAICYELSIPQHAQQAFAAGAATYIASVAKTERGIEEASRRLAGIAAEYAALVMLSNCVGVLDGVECAGRSSLWSRSGKLLTRLDTESEGVIVVDYDSEAVAIDTLD